MGPISRVVNTALPAALAMGLFLVLGAATRPAVAPEPDPVPTRWQLDLDIVDLRVRTMPTDEGPRPFFYLTYQVTNNSGEDILFAPRWELATDEGDLLRSGHGVPMAVTRDLLEMLENPFLESQVEISGPLLQGEENAREGLVIWPVTGLHIDEIQLFGAGFSGETATLEVPDPATGQPKRVVLRKTFEVDYQVLGDLDIVSSAPLTRAGTGRTRWIMR